MFKARYPFLLAHESLPQQANAPGGKYYYYCRNYYKWQIFNHFYEGNMHAFSEPNGVVFLGEVVLLDDKDEKRHSDHREQEEHHLQKTEDDRKKRGRTLFFRLKH